MAHSPNPEAPYAAPADEQQAWLDANRKLRMDANSPLFREDRRSFHLARYRFARDYCAGKRVLDGACGTGYGTALLGDVARSAMGIDFSHDAVGYASRVYGRDGVAFWRDFVEVTSFDADSFDVVVSFETVEHTLCPRAHMREIVRLLEPSSGLAILSVPNAWGLKDHHFFDFDVAMLRKLTSEFFGSAELYYQNTDSHPSHPGIGPLEATGRRDAECIVAVCRGPVKGSVASDRWGTALEEIYESAFRRHREFLELDRRDKHRLWSRVLRGLRGSGNR